MDYLEFWEDSSSYGSRSLHVVEWSIKVFIIEMVELSSPFVLWKRGMINGMDFEDTWDDEFYNQGNITTYNVSKPYLV